MIRIPARTIMVLVVLSFTTFGFAQPLTFTTSALSGEEVPGTAGETYSNFPTFQAAHIDGDGHTTFIANIDGGDQVLVSESGSSPQLIARTNTQAPGTAAGVDYSVFGSVLVNRAGDIAFSALLSGAPTDTTNDSALFNRLGSGSTELVVQKGDDSGSGDGSLLGDFFNLRIDNDGGLGFGSFLEDAEVQNAQGAGGTGTRRVALYGKWNPGPPQQLVRTGQPFGSGTVQDVGSLAISSSGGNQQAVYTQQIDHEQGVDPTTQVVSQATAQGGGSVLVLWEAEQAAPGLADGTTLEDFFAPQITDSNYASVFAYYTGAETGAGNLTFLIEQGTATNAQFAVKTNDPAPEPLPPGATLPYSVTDRLNQNGRTVYVLGIQFPVPAEGTHLGTGAGGELTEGIFFQDQNGDLQLAGYNGQQAPGLPAGVTLQQIGFPAFNALGQVAFLAALDGPGVEFFKNDQALFITDTNGDLQLLVRKGDLFDVNDDPLVEDLRTINGISSPISSGGTSGLSRSLNDSGQLAMTLSFTDFTSGVFVADTVAAPVGIPGDYNNDGQVDAADYVAWRKNPDAFGGTPEGYDTWVANFGGTGGGSGADTSTGAVREPASSVVLLFAMPLILNWRMRPRPVIRHGH